MRWRWWCGTARMRERAGQEHHATDKVLREWQKLNQAKKKTEAVHLAQIDCNSYKSLACMSIDDLEAM
jgi:hypothetical protein